MTKKIILSTSHGPPDVFSKVGSPSIRFTYVLIHLNAAPITQALEPTSSILEPGDILSTNPGQVSARTQRHSNALDDDDEELAAVSRVPEGKLRFWESLLKPRGFEVTTTGNLQRSPGKEKATTRRAYLEEEPINQGSNTRSVISSFRAGNSFLQEPRPLQRTNTAGMSITASTSRLGGQQSSVNQRQQQGLFSGLRLLVLGEARSPSVQKAIEDAGGKYMSPDMEDEGEPDYIVVRLVRCVDFTDDRHVLIFW